MIMPTNAIVIAMLKEDNLARVHELLNPERPYTSLEAITPETIALLKEKGYLTNEIKQDNLSFIVFASRWCLSKIYLPSDEHNKIIMHILDACSTILESMNYFLTLTMITAIIEDGIKNINAIKKNHDDNENAEAAITKLNALAEQLNQQLKGPALQQLKKHMLEIIPQPKAPALVQQPDYNFREAFFNWTHDQADEAEKETLFTHLLEPANNTQTIDAIKAQLRSLNDAEKIKKLKSKLIEFVKADPAGTRKQNMITTRTHELANENKQATTYLTLILGLGRSNFDFIQSSSLTELDIELRIQQPSEVKRGLQRLGQWAKSKMPESKEAKTADVLTNKGPQ
jgi:hypothetical protein